MEPSFGLDIRLPDRGSRHILRALHGQLRDAILDGRLKSGFELPPTRKFATLLGISRNTVVAAYDRLLGEGYVVARRGDGTRVANILPVGGREPISALEDGDVRLTSYWRERDPILPHCLRTFRHDFRLGTTDVTRFPLPIWRRLQARALYALTRAPADYTAPEGRPALREAITRHVSFARAVACGPDDVVVTSGAQQAFDLLARILVTSGRTRVAVEDPGYPPLRAAFAAAHAEIVPIPIDDEGLVVDRLPVDVTVIAVTPSHQFPLGVAMSPRRRMELLAFANRRNAIIIEDDYDGEFRFSGHPVEALQTLDRAGSVFYVGTFSKCLLPALRLGYVVTPGWARRALVAAKQIADWNTPVVAQDTLAVFIAEGHLARHVRTMRRVYAERRMVLSEALARHCMGRIELIPSIAGLHMSVRLIASKDSESVSAAVAELGLGIETLERYAIADRSWKGLAFGIGSIETTKIEEAVLLLAQQLD